MVSRRLDITLNLKPELPGCYLQRYHQHLPKSDAAALLVLRISGERPVSLNSRVYIRISRDRYDDLRQVSHLMGSGLAVWVSSAEECVRLQWFTGYSLRPA